MQSDNEASQSLDCVISPQQSQTVSNIARTLKDQPKGKGKQIKRKRKNSSVQDEDLKLAKRSSRARNFTEDKTCLIVEEGKKSLRLLKGRFGPF